MNDWCLYIFTYLVILTVIVSCETTDQSERRMIDDVTWNYRVKLIGKTVWTFGDKVIILVIWTSKKSSNNSLVVRSDSCEWRCGEISYTEPGSEKNCRWSDERSSRRQCKRSRRSFTSQIASGWQSVNRWKSNDGEIFGRQDSGSTTRNASLWDDHRLHIDPSIACVHCLWLEP